MTDHPHGTSSSAPLITTFALRQSRLVHGVLLTATLGVFTLAWILQRRPPVTHEFVVDEHRLASTSDTPEYREHLVSSRVTGFVHSATQVITGNGDIRAFWMGGTREGHRDVVLFTSVFNREAEEWSPAREIMKVDRLKRVLGRNIITLGNSVAWRHDDGRLFLWFVSVSAGGWSGSAINLMISHDDGKSWGAPKRLITTPMFNLSTLVKSPPILFTDGTIGLPVYHENMAKFAELLRLDTNGRVIYKQRLTAGRSTLQPEITPLSPTHAVAFLRRAGSAPRRVHSIFTTDGGRTWSDPEVLDIPNPSGPVSAVRLESGDLLIAFNNTQHGDGRLSLAISPDAGRTYRIIHEVEDSDEEGRGVSYPNLLRTDDGEYHLLYTRYREHIKHVHFNDAWLEEKR